MKQAGFISGITLAFSVLLFAGNCDRDDFSFFSTSDQDLSAHVSDTTDKPEQVRIKIENQDAESGHELLNTIDWELRQPLDFSTSSITTTARSSASEVKIHYTCGELERYTTLIPLDGKIRDTITWGCDTEMTAVLHAFKGDTLVEYSYKIDIAFLNNLGLN
jgi:hypothetical protein